MFRFWVNPRSWVRVRVGLGGDLPCNSNNGYALHLSKVISGLS